MARKIIIRGGKYVLVNPKVRKITKPRKKVHENVLPGMSDHLFDFFAKYKGIYIPYNVISSKNSKEIIFVPGKHGHKVPKIIPSAPYQQYQLLSSRWWVNGKKIFHDLVKDLEKPYKLHFFFIRATEGIWDYHNMIQGPADIMVAKEWLGADDKDSMIPLPLGYTVDKVRQGLIIFIDPPKIPLGRLDTEFPWFPSFNKD